MTTPAIHDVKMFVPTKDFAVSKRFYQAIGGNINWQDDDGGLCEIELGGTRFFLQNYYVKAWANNFMMQLVVDDAAAWYEVISAEIAANDYGAARLQQPKQEPWATVTYVWDPCGVLLHFTQFK